MVGPDYSVALRNQLPVSAYALAESHKEIIRFWQVIAQFPELTQWQIGVPSMTLGFSDWNQARPYAQGETPFGFTIVRIFDRRVSMVVPVDTEDQARPILKALDAAWAKAFENHLPRKFNRYFDFDARVPGVAFDVDLMVDYDVDQSRFVAASLSNYESTQTAFAEFLKRARQLMTKP